MDTKRIALCKRTGALLMLLVCLFTWLPLTVSAEDDTFEVSFDYGSGNVITDTIPGAGGKATVEVPANGPYQTDWKLAGDGTDVDLDGGYEISADTTFVANPVKYNLQVTVEKNGASAGNASLFYPAGEIIDVNALLAEAGVAAAGYDWSLSETLATMPAEAKSVTLSGMPQAGVKTVVFQVEANGAVTKLASIEVEDGQPIPFPQRVDEAHYLITTEGEWKDRRIEKWTWNGGETTPDQVGSLTKAAGAQTYTAVLAARYTLSFEAYNAEADSFVPAEGAAGAIGPRYAYAGDLFTRPETPVDPAGKDAFGNWYIKGYGSPYDFSYGASQDLTLVAYFGSNVPNAPQQVTAEMLLNLNPQIALQYEHGANKSVPLPTGTATPAATRPANSCGIGYINGSYTPGESGYIENVTFILKVTSDVPSQTLSHIKVAPFNSEAYDTKVEERGDGIYVEITRKKIESNNSGEISTYCLFYYYFENSTTPVDTVATFELVEVRVDNLLSPVSVGPADWADLDEYPWAAHTVKKAIAASGNSWSLKTPGTTSGAATLSGRTEGDEYTTGKRYYAPGTSPVFNVGAKSGFLDKKYVSATEVGFAVKVYPTGGKSPEGTILGFSPDLVTALTPAAAGEVFPILRKDAGGGAAVNATFEKYFGFGSATAQALVDAGWRIDGVIEKDAGGKDVLTLYYTWEKLEANAFLYDLAPQLSVKQFYFTRELTDGDVFTGNDLLKYEMGYLAGEDANGEPYNYAKWPVMDSGALTYPKFGMTDVTGKASVSLAIDAATTIESGVDKLLATIAKNTSTWYYDPAGYASGEDQFGRSGTSSRSWVAKGNVNLPGGKSIDLETCWFTWYFGAYASGVPLSVETLTIQETEGGNNRLSRPAATPPNAGWDPDDMGVEAFALPSATAADWELTVSFSVGGEAVIRDTDTFATASYPNLTYKLAPAAGGPRHVLMVDSGETVTGFKLVYSQQEVSSQKVPMQLGTPMAVMYRTKKDEAKTEDYYIYNNSFIQAKYQDKGIAAEKQVEREARVQFRQTYEDYMFGKQVTNLTHVTGDPTGGLGHRPGDDLLYTLTFEVPSSNHLGFVENLALRDVANKFIALDPSTLDCTVTIDFASYNAATSAKLDTSMYTASGSNPTVSGNKMTYTGVKPEIKDWDDDDKDTRMYYFFEGRLNKGDKITITYHAKVGQNATTEGEELTNKLYYRVWKKNPYPGGGQGGDGEWEDTGRSATIRVSGTKMYGDVKLNQYPRRYQVDGWTGPENDSAPIQNQAYLAGDPINAQITGGLIRSEMEMAQPSFIIKLDDDTVLDPIGHASYGPGGNLNPVYGDLIYDVHKYAVTYNNTDQSRQYLSGEDPLDDAEKTGIKVELFKDAACTQAAADASEARAVRVTFAGTTLSNNQVLSFRLSLKAADNTASGKAVVYLAGEDPDIGNPEPMELNRHYAESDKADWGTSMGASATYPAVPTRACVKAESKIVIHTGLSHLGVDKGIIDYNTESGRTNVTLLEGDELAYQLTFRRENIIGLSDVINNIPSFRLYQLVDLLPPGQVVDEESIVVETKTGPMSDTLYEVKLEEVQDAAVTTPGSERPARTLQRLVIEFTGGVSLKLDEWVSVKYKATQDNVDFLLNEGDLYESKAYNRVSAFYNAEEATVKSGVENKGKYADDTDKDKDLWWKGYTFGADSGLSMDNYSRMESKTEMTIRDTRIAPGIQKTLVGSQADLEPAGQDFVDATWKVQAYNGSTAGRALYGYYIVDVLPYGVLYQGPQPSTDTNSVPDYTYERKDGSQVLVWDRTGDSLAKNTSDTVTFNVRINAKLAFGDLENIAYLIPIGANNRFAATDVAKSGNTLLGKFCAANEVTDLTRYDDGNNDAVLNALIDKMAGNAAVVDTDTVTLLNFLSASASKQVSNASGTTTTSATQHTTVPAARGELVEYTYQLRNYSVGFEYESLEFFDVLPHRGDLFLNQKGRLRGSAWGLEFEEGTPPLDAFTLYNVANGKTPTVDDVVAPGDIELMFTDTVPGQGYKGLTGHAWEDAATWVNDHPGESPAAFRLKMASGYELKPGRSLVLTWSMQVPDDLPAQYSAGSAFNSAMFLLTYQGQFFYAEPGKVGVQVKLLQNLGLAITKDLQDEEFPANGQKTFRFQILRDIDGRGQYKPLTTLDQSMLSGGLTMDPNDRSVVSLTLNSGMAKKTGYISGLTEGAYIVKELDMDNQTYFTVTGKEQNVTLGGLNGSQAVTVVNRHEALPPPPVSSSSSSSSSSSQTTSSSSSSPQIPSSSGGGGASGTPGSSSGGGSSNPPPPVPDPSSSSAVPSSSPGGGGPFIPRGIIIPDPVSSTSASSAPVVSELEPASMPLAALEPDEIPAAGPGAHWSLLNLICALFCLVTSIVMLVALLVRKLSRSRDEEDPNQAVEEQVMFPEDDEVGDENKHRKAGVIWRVLSGLVAVASVITFLLTENLRNPMVWVCEWTPLMVVFAIIQMLVLLALRINQRRQNEGDEDEMTENET